MQGIPLQLPIKLNHGPHSLGGKKIQESEKGNPEVEKEAGIKQLESEEKDFSKILEKISKKKTGPDKEAIEEDLVDNLMKVKNVVIDFKDLKDPKKNSLKEVKVSGDTNSRELVQDKTEKDLICLDEKEVLLGNLVNLNISNAKVENDENNKKDESSEDIEKAKVGLSTLDLMKNGEKDKIERSSFVETKKAATLSGQVDIDSKGLKNTDDKTDMLSEKPIGFSKNMVTGDSSDDYLNNFTEDQISKEHSKVMTADDYLKNLAPFERKNLSKLSTGYPLDDLQKSKTKNNKLVDLENEKIENNKIKTDSSSLDVIKNIQVANKKESLLTPEKKIINSNNEKEGDDILKISSPLELVVGKSKNNQESERNLDSNKNVLDLNGIKTSNTNEIVKKISDFIEQNVVANKNELELTVKHESLGEFKIQVSKSPVLSNDKAQGLIDMQITTSSKEGHDFFVKNEISLMKNLSQSGVNLSDLRIVSNITESSPFMQNDFSKTTTFSQNGNNSNNSERSFPQSESNNFQSNLDGETGRGSEKRKELWEEYRQKYGV